MSDHTDTGDDEMPLLSGPIPAKAELAELAGVSIDEIDDDETD